MNAVTRYYINNFCDGYNHDCLDITLGKLNPSPNMKKKGFLTPLKITFITVKNNIIIKNLFLYSSDWEYIF